MKQRDARGTRRQIVKVDRQKVLEMIHAPQAKYPDYYAWVEMATLPEDAEVVEVFYDAAWSAFMFIVESEEFPIVPMGERYPLMDPGGLEVRLHKVCDQGSCQAVKPIMSAYPEDAGLLTFGSKDDTHD